MAAFVCLERKTEAKIKYMLYLYKNICHAKVESIRWAMPWPKVACQEVPTEYLVQREKNINHLRRNKLSKITKVVCALNEIGFEVIKGSETGLIVRYFSADISKGR